MQSKILKLKVWMVSHTEYWLPILVLLICLPVTYSIWQSQRQYAIQDHRLLFEYKVKDTANLIDQNLHIHEQPLLGLRSFFMASNFVDASEFHEYVTEILASDRRYVGLERLSYAKWMREDVTDSYAFIHPDWQEVFKKIKSRNGGSDFAPILYSEARAPLVPETYFMDLLGTSDHARAMQHALEVNEVELSIDLAIVNAERKYQRISLYLPIYQNHLPHETVADKKSHIVGWVIAEVNLEEFFSKIVQPLVGHEFVIQVIDTTPNHHQQHIFSNAEFESVKQPLYTKNHYLNIFGSEWLLTVKSTPAFEKNINFDHEDLIGLLGALTSIGVAIVLHLLLVRLRTISEIKHVNTKLSVSEQRWQFALEGAGDGVWDWDLESGRVLFSKRWKEMFGFQDGELRDDIDIWKFRIHPEAYTSVMQKLEDALKGVNNSYVAEYRMQCKDGAWKWILDRGMVVARDDTGKPLRMVGTHADISTLKESEEAIWQHANFDLLTGLPNRRMLYGRLDQEIQKANRTGQKVAIIFLDLDRFKEVNDTQGHDQGDLLLKLAAERLVKCMRGSDAVARLGGDEFVLLVGGVDLHDLSHLDNVAQKVIAALSEPFKLTNEWAYISASLGMAIYPDDASTVEDLMKCVDQAMYASKRKGGTCFTYFMPHMQEIAQHRMQLSNDLRQALNHQELFIEYQPIVNLQSGEVYKAEALLRWRHPLHGLVSPVEFIPIAEENRLILEIGDWVFQEAIKQALLWREKIHPKFQLTVNKSPVQFNDEDNTFRNWLSRVKSFNKPAEFLVVEITEGLLLDASQKVQSRLIEFQEMGIQVALDDFGTGYSSLSYLKKFDIDYLKIDRSFITHLTENSDDLVLCEAIIVMAHRLGIKVIAEGIETEAQMALLKQAGCDYGQGYFFSRPVSVAAFETFASEKKHT